MITIGHGRFEGKVVWRGLLQFAQMLCIIGIFQAIKGKLSNLFAAMFGLYGALRWYVNSVSFLFMISFGDFSHPN